VPGEKTLDFVSGGGCSVKILIVDDDRGTCNALKAGMCSLGYQVVVAQEGSQALEIIETSNEGPEPVDFVIADLRMPGMNGLDLIRSLKRERPGLACILMTGTVNDDIRKEALALGACEYIEKPFMPKALLEMIDTLKPRKLEKSTPLERVVRKAAGLSPGETQDTVAGLPGDSSAFR
jgi:DNA-binding response OmpR family regulator